VALTNNNVYWHCRQNN